MLGSVSEEKLAEIRARLPEFLSEKRLQHTFFVEKEAITIAESNFLVYNSKSGFANDLKAAALLHDLTKEMPLDEHIRILQEHGEEIGANASEAVLHGHSAAYLAQELFGIGDEVFSAIYYHTTGYADMTLLDTLIFLADYTEESRTHPTCKAVREYLHTEFPKRPREDAETVLCEAMLMSLEFTLSHLLQKHCVIDTKTLDAYNFLAAHGIRAKNISTVS